MITHLEIVKETVVILSIYDKSETNPISDDEMGGWRLLTCELNKRYLNAPPI